VLTVIVKLTMGSYTPPADPINLLVIVHHNPGIALVWCDTLKRKEKNYVSSKTAAHINQGKGATWGEKPLHQKRKGRSVRIRWVASRQASRPLLIYLKVRRMLKRMSGLHKLMSIVHRMGMKHESKAHGSAYQGRDSSEEPECEECT